MYLVRHGVCDHVSRLVNMCTDVLVYLYVCISGMFPREERKEGAPGRPVLLSITGGDII